MQNQPGTTSYRPRGKFNTPDDAATELGHRIAIHFAAGNHQAARDTLEAAIREATIGVEVLSDPLAAPLSALGISVRTLNALESTGLATVGDLRHVSRAQLLLIPNFADKALKEVCDALIKYLDTHGIRRS